MCLSCFLGCRNRCRTHSKMCVRTRRTGSCPHRKMHPKYHVIADWLRNDGKRLLLEEKLSAELTDEVATSASGGSFAIPPHPSRLVPCHLLLKEKAVIVPFAHRKMCVRTRRTGSCPRRKMPPQYTTSLRTGFAMTGKGFSLRRSCQRS